MVKLLKRFWHFYMDSMLEAYRPMIENGVNPFM